MGVLVISALPSGVDIRTPDFWALPSIFLRMTPDCAAETRYLDGRTRAIARGGRSAAPKYC